MAAKVGGGRGVGWDFGIGRCKLLPFLMYSTGNHIESPVINHNGKEFKKNVCMCITESLCSTAAFQTLLLTMRLLHFI